MNLTGTIHEVMPAIQRGKGQSRKFVVKTTTTNGDKQWNDYITFELWGDKVDLVSEGDTGKEVTVHYNLRGNRWEKDGTTKYFNSLQAWKVEANQTDEEYYEEQPF